MTEELLIKIGSYAFIALVAVCMIAAAYAGQKAKETQKRNGTWRH